MNRKVRFFSFLFSIVFMAVVLFAEYLSLLYLKTFLITIDSPEVIAKLSSILFIIMNLIGFIFTIGIGLIGTIFHLRSSKSSFVGFRFTGKIFTILNTLILIGNVFIIIILVTSPEGFESLKNLLI